MTDMPFSDALPRRSWKKPVLLVVFFVAIAGAAWPLLKARQSRLARQTQLDRQSQLARQAPPASELGATNERQAPPTADAPASSAPGVRRVIKTEAQWRKLLTPEQYAVCRLKETELPGSGEFWNSKEKGEYCCVCCGSTLFRSEEKYDSGTGWPSFWERVPGSVRTETDQSLFRTRVEVLCAVCDSHLGHVFDDGPPPTGLRYCINSVALKLKKE